MSSEQPRELVFSQPETDLLGRTADALTAYLGKPVIAEIVVIDDGPVESAIFAIPLQKDDDTADITEVQIGGTDARFLGNRGGLDLSDGAIYQCQFLWAIQLVSLEHIRFIKIDAEGDEVGWSDDLAALLPFNLTEPPAAPDEPDEPDPIISNPSKTLH